MSEETPQPQVTLGQTLSRARQAAQLNVEFIAAQLKLTPLQIDAIEKDDYLSLGPETFVRGYIKGFCRLVNVDVDSTLALYIGHPEPEKKRRMKSFSRRTEKEANDNRLMWVSYLILALVIGSSLFWWWQTTATEPVTNEQSEAVRLLDESDLSNELETLEEPESLDTGADPLSDELVGETRVVETTSNSTSNEEQTVTDVDTSAPVVSPEAIIETAPTVVETPPVKSEFSTIVMQFREESWVEIFDSTSERIAFGVKKAGYVMTVSGKAPFSVVLVKHHAVDVTLDGETVDLSFLQRNRLAKFKLPLTE
ncbi:FIG021952: putative membrane protein [Pseudoalteromonas luteoviolacea B = ATCC 29581]|nr:FIG021952: putative membrane protein [Pseudoalteromonas luteoviolacea B = ATCC 29581]